MKLLTDIADRLGAIAGEPVIDTDALRLEARRIVVIAQDIDLGIYEPDGDQA